MKSIDGALGDIQRVLGNPGRGCPFCAEVGLKVAANGAVALYHPAVDCCPAGIVRQLRWRQAEIERLKAAIEGEFRPLGELSEQLELEELAGNGKAMRELSSRRTRLKAAIDRRVEVLNQRVRETEAEQRELSVKLRHFGLDRAGVEEAIGQVKGFETGDYTFVWPLLGVRV